MKQEIRKFLTALVIITIVLCIPSCIDPLPQESGEVPKVVVIDGQFSDRLGPQNIRLSEAVELNSQVPIPISNAQVEVISDLGETIRFLEKSDDKGNYEIESQAVDGREYMLHITLSDGSEISSAFQSVPPSLPIDTLKMEDDLVSFVDESGRSRTRWILDFSVGSSLDRVEQDYFIRYDLETVWQLTEVQCSPLHTIKICYIYDRNIAFDIELLEIPQSDNPISFEQKVYQRFIDEAIGEVMAVKVDVISYNEEQYRYWEKIQSVFSQTGNITDQLPARVNSNFSSTNDISVAGQFSVVGQSEKVLFVRNADVELNVNPVCGAPGFRPWPLPRECCSCGLREGASTAKPYYWPF